jgi:hypothetical protein
MLPAGGAVSRVSRKVNAEVTNGHPGFAWHQATTEDLTQATERFILRRLPCGCHRVDYRPALLPTVRLNRPRTRLGAWFTRRFNR